ncbi:MAG: hypothetical protein KJ015_29830, partial [Myxococcales bacterium]|nr:hypothetical protein [Myxococcales bacterium]
PGTGGVPGTGGLPGTGGATSLTCKDIDLAYQKALADAKLCNKGSTAPCSKKVAKDVACGCETFVNANAQIALAALDAAMKAWQAKGCTKACPEIACFEPKAAECTTSGSGSAGKCSDLAANQ